MLIKLKGYYSDNFIYRFDRVLDCVNLVIYVKTKDTQKYEEIQHPVNYYSQTVFYYIFILQGTLLEFELDNNED